MVHPGSCDPNPALKKWQRLLLPMKCPKEEQAKEVKPSLPPKTNSLP